MSQTSVILSLKKKKWKTFKTYLCPLHIHRAKAISDLTNKHLSSRIILKYKEFTEIFFGQKDKGLN